jgi:hypothetical protein
LTDLTNRSAYALAFAAGLILWKLLSETPILFLLLYEHSALRKIIGQPGLARNGEQHQG